MRFGAVAIALALAALAISPATARPPSCPHWGRPAVAADPRPHALRVFAIQFRQQPAKILSASDYARAVDCALRLEVVPYLARGRANLVVFDEDIGLETLATGPRGAPVRALLLHGAPGCAGKPSPCQTLGVLAALNRSYGGPLAFLAARYPGLSSQLGAGFVAASDTFVRVFMATMASEARRYGVYIVASNTQAPFRLTSDPRTVAALGIAGERSVYAPTAGVAYDQTFLWGPRIVHRGAPAPLANLIAVNRKVPLTPFEAALGFASGPASGPAAIANLRPVAIPGTRARLGFATSLPAFAYGPVRSGHQCDEVTISYMRCLNRLGANVVIQADANDGQWSGPDGSDVLETWQPLSWMGSAWRAVSDPTVSFSYAVNPFMVGNLADTPFDGQSAILERGRRGAGCYYVGDRRFIAGEDDPSLRAYAGAKPQFLALAPWIAPPDRPRPLLRIGGQALAGNRLRYVQTAVIADLPFPVDRQRPGCLVAGR